MKRVSKYARGKQAKAQVFHGRKMATAGGITKDGLIKNRKGKLVSKKGSERGKKNFSFIADWTDAVIKARMFLGSEGFVLLKRGTPLYEKAKEMYIK